MTRRRVSFVGLVVLLAASALAGVVSAQRGRSLFAAAYENVPYNGRFTFSRIRYGGRGFRGGSSWAHDYPRADEHLSMLMESLTSLNPNLERTNVFDLEDPEIFRHPILYVSEPGFWSISETGARNLRAHLLKGGFVIFDDFEAGQWVNFEAQFRRALPEAEFVEIDARHPVFHVFFEIDDIDVPHPLVRVDPIYLAVFEGNDPSGRMMALVNYNNDLAEYWEWSGAGVFPVDTTNEAWKLGINYLIYGLT
ncbi:MAG TPA: DUF4159 domain-containing protein, partial [Vicinamibacterales bacterium]|nr:DUF4159 domain-containing protein [Vicinamibacterales bacterium]